jgi:hypothetical protein
VCISNEGYASSLESRKIYVALPDAEGEANGLVRVVDESGDAYLFPKAMFEPIALTPALSRAVLAAA